MHCKVLIKNVSIQTSRAAPPQLEGFYLSCSRLFILFANQTLGFGLSYPLERHIHLLFLTSGLGNNKYMIIVCFAIVA